MTRRKWLFLGIFLSLSLAIPIAFGEWFVRSRGRWDSDGTFYFQDRPVRPYALPVLRARANIDRYLKDSSGYLLYDPGLGWISRPRTCTPDGSACANAASMRGDREHTLAVRPGAFRISMFGDSFIQGADVGLADSLAIQVEGLLKARGIDAEVLNFGMGGYGFDQAYLRYRRDGVRFDTSVIVQGLQLENIGRGVTLFRIVALPGTSIPFTKPRFILRGGALELINQPTIAPEDVPGTLARFHEWPLAQYEGFYPVRYRHRWYSHSKLIATAVDRWDERRDAKHDRPGDVYSVRGEAMDLTLVLLERYRDEVRKSGKPFILVYLPRQDSMDALAAGERDPWQGHLDRLSGFEISDPRPRLLAHARQHGVQSLFQGHYTAVGYRLVAETLADTLAPLAN